MYRRYSDITIWYGSNTSGSPCVLLYKCYTNTCNAPLSTLNLYVTRCIDIIWLRIWWVLRLRWNGYVLAWAGWIARTNSSRQFRRSTPTDVHIAIRSPLSLSFIPYTKNPLIHIEFANVSNHFDTPCVYVCVHVCECVCVCHFIRRGTFAQVDLVVFLKIDWQGQPPSKRDRREQRAAHPAQLRSDSSLHTQTDGTVLVCGARKERRIKWRMDGREWKQRTEQCCVVVVDIIFSFFLRLWTWFIVYGIFIDWALFQLRKMFLGRWRVDMDSIEGTNLDGSREFWANCMRDWRWHGQLEHTGFGSVGVITRLFFLQNYNVFLIVICSLYLQLIRNW